MGLPKITKFAAALLAPSVGAFTPPCPPSGARPPGGGNKNVEPIETGNLRECIAKVGVARENHAVVMAQKDLAAAGLAKLRNDRASLWASVRSKEKEIAESGGKLPDGPFPEDAEINQLDRHIRIGEDRVRLAEQKVTESLAGINESCAEMGRAWVAVGESIGGRLA